jgi:hypothetical protein
MRDGDGPHVRRVCAAHFENLPRAEGIDRAFADFLLISVGGHAYGSLAGYADQPTTLLWSLRTFRPTDRAVAWLTLAGTAFWFGASLMFGRLIGNLFDPRVLFHALVAFGLILFGLRSAPSRSPAQESCG